MINSPEEEKIVKKRLKIFLAIFFLLMIGPLAIVYNYLSHDYKLFQLGLSYRQIRHPATTTYIATMRRCMGL